MTPTYLWVFLLALVGRAASTPRPLVVDACALICNPGAETESEQARDPTLYPRYPKVNCKLQSDTDLQHARIIASQCLKLCSPELELTMEINCFALRSSLGANLGCFCEALTPLSPNTMRLHESWRLDYLVGELANDILTVILESPLDTLILCEIYEEVIPKDKHRGQLLEKCRKIQLDNSTESDTGSSSESKSRRKREDNDFLEEENEAKPEKTRPEIMSPEMEQEVPRLPPDDIDMDVDDVDTELNEELTDKEKTSKEENKEETREEVDKEGTREEVNKEETNEEINTEETSKEINKEETREKREVNEEGTTEENDTKQTEELEAVVNHLKWNTMCSQICKHKLGSSYCNCNNPLLGLK